MNLHEIRMAGIRAAEDAVVRDLEKSGLAALTGAQPAPSDTDAEHAAWLADKIVAHGDYAKEAAAMLRRWPACSAAPAAPSEDAVLVDWPSETDDPLAEMDRIHAEYSKTFGRHPDAEMGRTVRKVKEMLFDWWGWHGERIRAALFLAEAEDAAPAAQPADRAAQWLVEVRDQFRQMAEQANQALTRHVADLAQPADSAMEVLRELVACEDFKDEFRHITRGVYAPAAVQLADEYGRRVKAAIDRARTLSAASNKDR